MRKASSKLVIISVLFLCGFILVPLNAIAECSGNRCLGKIERIYVRKAGDVRIGTNGDENQLDCEPASGVYILLEESAPRFKEIYASLLTAATAKKRLKIRVHDDGGECRVKYIVYPY
jgi:hypothetical protein